MTVKTRATLNSEADTAIPDNTAGETSPADVRQRIKDLADSAILAEDFATAAEIRSASAKPVQADDVLTAMEWVALTDGANIAVDHAAGCNRTVTLAGNRTVDNPTNHKIGWPLNIAVKQDATGSRTLTWGSHYDFGDAGAPTLTTTANDEDILCFTVRSTTKVVYLGIRKSVA